MFFTSHSEDAPVVDARFVFGRLGLAHSTLGHWENNRSSLNAFHLLRIAEITGADVFLLLTGEPSPHSEKASHKSERAA